MVRRPFRHDETWHDDRRHRLSPKEKRAPARARLRRSYVAALKRQRENKKRYASVIAALESCRKGARCGSAACPECHCGENRYFCQAIEREFGGIGRLVMSTVIPTTPEIMPVTFGEARRCRWKSWLKKTLTDAGMASMPVVAGLDVSINTFRGRKGVRSIAYICLHVCLFTTDRDPPTLTKALRAVIKDHPLVAVPVVSKPITVTPERARSYGLKNRFEQIQFVSTKRANGKAGFRQDAKGTIGTKHPNFAELLLFLHQRGLDGRIFAQNLRFHDTRLRPKAKGDTTL